MAESRIGELLGVTWPLTAVSLAFLAGRVFCRLRYVRLWWDDWCAIAAGVLLLASSISYTVEASLGGTEHYWELTPSQLVTATRANWIAQPYSILCLMAGKVAVGLLIQRLQAPCRWRSWTLGVSLAIMCLYDCVEVVLFFTLCTPVWAIWNPKAAPPDTHCLASDVLIKNGQAVSSYMGFIDLLLAALAAQMIWQLQMPLRRKITICMFLCAGVAAFIFAMLKVVAIPHDASGPDALWDSVELLIWGTVEPSVVLIAACVPTLLPLFSGTAAGTKSQGSYAAGPFSYDHTRSRARKQSSLASGTEDMLAMHDLEAELPDAHLAAEPVPGRIAVRRDIWVDNQLEAGLGRAHRPF